MRYNNLMSRDTLAVLGYKKQVDARLLAVLADAKKEYKNLPWSADAIDKLVQFVVAGKTVRGSLVIYSYRLFHKDMPPVVLDAAAALELFHSGLLIHDDIMDRDTIRRGKPTVHSQYEMLAAQKKGTDCTHFGISEAINLADLCYFLGFRLLSVAGAVIIELVGRELAAVTLAQMQDVAGSHLPTRYSKKDILTLYRYKTARYTFSLPFLVGALLSQTDDRIRTELTELGESLGLLFQIRDDELNALGKSEETGKSTGSDTSNHTQTLRSVIEENELGRTRQEARVHAQSILRTLPVSDEHRRELVSLLRFCEERTA